METREDILRWAGLYAAEEPRLRLLRALGSHMLVLPIPSGQMFSLFLAVGTPLKPPPEVDWEFMSSIATLGGATVLLDRWLAAQEVLLQYLEQDRGGDDDGDMLAPADMPPVDCPSKLEPAS